MKKFKNILLTLCLLLSILVVLPACKPKIEGGVVKTGTLSTTIVKGEELDTSHVLVIYTYSDKTTKEVESKDLTFGQFDSSKLGTQELEITYDNFTFSVRIKVVATEADVNIITSLESELINEFNEKRGAQDSVYDQFSVGDEPMYVGDDNPLDFRIFATGIDGEGQLQTDIKKVRTDIEVAIKVGSGYVTLTGDDLDKYVTIDTINTRLQFKPEACGNEFKVNVSAKNVSPIYVENKTSFEAVLKVIDGYNVYNARDLSLYDNVSSGYDAIRPLDKSVKVNALILQNDIYVTKEDVRQDIFWTESTANYSRAKDATDQTLLGTPIDNSSDGVYHRVMGSGENFEFIGNYFMVNASKFPKLVIEGKGGAEKLIGVRTEKGKENIMTTHFSLFYNEADESNSDISNISWKNLNFVGNGAATADPINSGAIILCKAKKSNYTAYNNLVNFFYMANFFSYEPDMKVLSGEGFNVINKCKAYNSYQTLLYLFGCKHLLIEDSEFVGAGGPAMIVDHVENDAETGEGGTTSEVDIINTKIESLVSGKEPWFTSYGVGSIVGDIVKADQLFSGKIINEETGEETEQEILKTNKTIIADYVESESTGKRDLGRLNIMAVMKSSKNQGATSTRIRGYIRLFKDRESYEKHYGLNNTTQENMTYGLDMATDGLMNDAFKQNNFFQNNSNGGYINDGFNGTSNTKASKVEGTVKAITMYKVIQGVFNGVSDEATKQALLSMLPTDAQFNSLELDDKKIALKQIINAIAPSERVSEEQSKALLDNIKTYLVSANSSVCQTIKVPAEFDSADTTASRKVEILTNIIDGMKNYTHGDGDYVNLYLSLGMGVVLGLYDRA